MLLSDAIRSFTYRIFHKHKRTGDFVRHRRYRLSLVNLNSLKTLFQVSLRKSGLWVSGVLLFILIGAIWLLALVYTPLRNILPMKLQADLRDEYVVLAARLDSANMATAMVDRYTSNLIAILTDTLEIDAEPKDIPAEVERLPLDSLIEASDAERSFVHRFEASERFNLSVLSPIAAEGMMFVPPVMGVEMEDKLSDAGIPYVLFATGKATPVSAIYRGTVINVYFTTGKGITVVVQHPNDFVSQYSGLAEVFVNKGDKVNAGTRLGIAMQSRYPLTFELWHKGSPLPPAEYIPF